MKDTEVIVKRTENQPWLEDSMFYMLTSNGLMICRNHEFFKSCAPARCGPGELAEQKPFMTIRYPKLKVDIFEAVCGWFDRMSDKYGEAACLIIYHDKTKTVDILVPDQECSWGSVEYKVPKLEPGWRLIGDIHSHVDMAAYSSVTDTNDEKHRPGVHIVVGRISQVTPEFHIEVVVDGHRFKVPDLDMVIEGDFRGKATFPEYWMSKVTKKKWLTGLWKSDKAYGTSDSGYSGHGHGYYHGPGRDRFYD